MVKAHSVEYSPGGDSLRFVSAVAANRLGLVSRERGRDQARDGAVLVVSVRAGVRCVFRGDPATCTDRIRPPIPI